MTGIRAIAFLAALFLVCVGLPIGLYLLLTAGRRRQVRAIRQAAAQQGWSFHTRRLLGDPTAFRIEGKTSEGRDWILTTAAASPQTSHWTSEMRVRIPSLAGQMDFDIAPREPAASGSKLPGSRLSPAQNQSIAQVSSSLVGALDFNSSAQEMPTGISAFDAAYRLLVQPGHFRRSPIDPSLAQEMLNWPEDSVRPVALLASRNPSGLHIEARLPATPNVCTISWILALAETLGSNLPAPEVGSTPVGIIDRLVDRVL